MRRQLIATGNTYALRNSLKKDGFRWNPTRKAWTKIYETENEQEQPEAIQTLIDAYEDNGVSFIIHTLSDPNERKYFVKESRIFNLESMHDKLWCIEYDLQEGKLQFPLRIANTDINNWEDLNNFRNECYDLEDIAKSRKVTGKEYGRIGEIVAWRVEVRYNRCLEAGMSEREAGRCYEDM